MPRPPQSTIRDSIGADACNKLVKAVRGKQQAQSHDHLLSTTTHGVFRETIVRRGFPPSQSTVRLINRGLYDPFAVYQHDQFVEYTPAGGQAGQYWCLEDGTTGVSPDTGAPSWTQTKYPSPGVWGA